ncbi:MAG: peptidoglycan editing factor PgeF, partial [Candidatus Puniceispirillaceae bacterium]
MTTTVPVNLEGGPQCYQHAGWQDGAAQKWHIRHGFFTANGGVSTGLYQSLNCGFGSNDDPALVAENRRRVANSLGFQPDQMFGLRQTHSASVVKIDSTSDASIDARADADALITNNSGYALAILTADCVPVLFAVPEMGVIGAAHAGWRGAVDGVLEATIAMMAKLGITPNQIEAVIGPAIQQANYQVGDDLRLAVLAAHDGADGFFDPDQDIDGKYRFDLPGFVQSRLRKAG